MIIMPYSQAINCVNTIKAHKTTMEAIQTIFFRTKKNVFHTENIICGKIGKVRISG